MSSASGSGQELAGVETCPINWPIGSGKEFQGAYDRPSGHILRFTDTSFKSRSAAEEIELSDPKMGELVLARIGGISCRRK